MTKVNVYITFNGNCEEAFNFYKSIFGGEVPIAWRYKDIPPSDKEKFQAESDEKMMNIPLPIAKRQS